MIKIYNRFDGALIREFDVDNMLDANMRGADLLDANMRGANMRGADLRGADLRGANLLDADLRGANLRGADLICADLIGANLIGADLRGADLRGANLRGSLIVIYGLQWEVYITKNHIMIGCQAHDLEKWESFIDEEINNMARDALDFWKENKEMIINLCRRLTNGI